MNITMESDLSLNLHSDDDSITYGQVEQALIDAGFEFYTIYRQVNPGSGSSIQIAIGGSLTQDVAEVFTALGEAFATLQGDTAPASGEPTS